MAQNTIPAGRLAVAYYNTSDTLIDNATNDPLTWTDLADTVVGGNVADVALNTDPTYADTNTRDNTAGGFSSQKPVIRQGEITFEMLHRTTDPISATAFESKILARADDLTPMAMIFYDYAAKNADLTAGDSVYGLAGNWYVAATKTEAIEDVQRWAVTLTQASQGQFVTKVGS